MRAMNQCGVCGTPRDVMADCRPCANKRNAAYKARKRAAGIKLPRPSRAKPEHLKKNGTVASRDRSAQNARRLKAEYKQRNPHKAVADCAARHAAKMRALPEWADRKLIDDLYWLSSIYTDAGFPTHVDHIVPLRSSIVCGLHVESNLEVVPATHNMLKGNRWWPDMPETTKPAEAGPVRLG